MHLTHIEKNDSQISLFERLATEVVAQFNPILSKPIDVNDVKKILINTFCEAKRITCPSLTTQENKVLHYFSKGFSKKMIAMELQISCRTVRFHRDNLMQKFHCRHKHEWQHLLMHWQFIQGFIQEELK